MLFGKYKKKSKFIKFKFREFITIKVFSLKVFSFIVLLRKKAFMRI